MTATNNRRHSDQPSSSPIRRPSCRSSTISGVPLPSAFPLPFPLLLIAFGDLKALVPNHLASISSTIITTSRLVIFHRRLRILVCTVKSVLYLSRKKTCRSQLSTAVVRYRGRLSLTAVIYSILIIEDNKHDNDDDTAGHRKSQSTAHITSCDWCTCWTCSCFNDDAIHHEDHQKVLINTLHTRPNVHILMSSLLATLHRVAKQSHHQLKINIVERRLPHPQPEIDKVSPPSPSLPLPSITLKENNLFRTTNYEMK